MRKGVFVPMITLSLLLTGCGGGREMTAESLRNQYRTMAGCTMEAEVRCDQDGEPWTAVLRCQYAPEGESEVEVLSPETIRGVRAVLTKGLPDGAGTASDWPGGLRTEDRAENWYLRYDGASLDAGPVSREEISPALCLPKLMEALREGWLVEENREEWDGVPCIRLLLDQTGAAAETVLTTLWLSLPDGAPVRGEIAVDGGTVLTASFTSFSFEDGAVNEDGATGG